MKSRLLLFTIIFVGIGCSSESGPVTLPVPFSGTLTGDNGIVVADGASATLGSSLHAGLSVAKEQSQSGCFPFPIFDSNGSNVGSCEYCPSSDVVSENIAFFEEFASFFPPGVSPTVGRRDSYTMPVTCNLEGNSSVSAELECFEFPYADASIPVESGAELRAGVCSGVVNSGSGECVGTVNTSLMDGRYVATTKIENGKKIFVRMDKWLWLLPCQASEPRTTQEGKILAMLFEPATLDDSVILPNLQNVPLFCEGQTPGIDSPCGHGVLSDFEIVTEPFPGIDSTAIICQGESCVTTFHTRQIPFPIPVEVPQLPGGLVESITITQTDPIFCRDLTGKFREMACPSPNDQDDDLANIQLDYRCVNFHDPNTLELLGTLGSSFIISIPEGGI